MRRLTVMMIGFVLVAMVGEPSFAQKKKVATKTKAQTQPAQSQVVAVTPSGNPSALSAPIRKPATLDPNSAVEVRGQARTLSMMLVLKNGKDSINFIKVRKDYRPEIPATDY